VLEEAVERIFVGTSPEHGKGFNGNSLLLKKSKNQYIFVGDSIFSFESEAEICKFSSPVGNNDVPYPWAADVDGRCYLVIENTVLSAVPEGDPYEYFYGDDFEKRVDWKLLWNNQPTGAPFDAAEQYQRMMGSKGKKEAGFAVRRADGTVEKVESEAAFVELAKKMNTALGVGPLRGVKELVARL